MEIHKELHNLLFQMSLNSATADEICYNESYTSSSPSSPTWSFTANKIDSLLANFVAVIIIPNPMRNSFGVKIPP
jgi:hypothetical protein